MPAEYDPTREVFDPQTSATPLIEAVRKLAEDSGESFASFTGRSFDELGHLADIAYDELPEFWRIWKDWHAPQPRPTMGDL